MVLDFFAGSGTTAHAVMRLNRQDGGQRRSIMVTNNEVAADEQKELREQGLRPGDPEWEQWGICEYITKPRIEAAITGKTPDGEPIKGDYKFTDEFPMADGFEENVEFFTLTYEAPLRVASNREFAKIAPLLWMRAGSRGRRIDDISAGWDVADTYGVLADLDQTEDFLKAIAAKRRRHCRFHRHRRGSPVRVRRAGAAGPRRAGSPVRGVPAQLRDRVRAGCAVKFTLLPYQAQAVDDVLANLKRARDNYKNPDKREISSFSLTATTGAGKTVMAAAAIEALFWGNETFDFEPDPGAVVLWFSDDPNLNEQTRTRLMQASEKFTYANLVRIEPPFSAAASHSRQGVLPEHAEAEREVAARARARGERQQSAAGQARFATPDLQGWTIWQTLANTIEADDLTLYLVLDEAHRGFNAKTTSDRPTIVRRLVNGTRARPPIPIVWGISATVERFETAMKEAEATRNRRALPAVLVDPGLVQESGLVKDTLVLDIPDEAGNFDSVLVRRAARKLKDSTERWAAYAASRGSDSRAVQPLLVLQTPNTPNPDDVGVALDTIFDEYPDLIGDQVRHVLGDHTTQKFGAWEVDWIEPQRVQEETQRAGPDRQGCDLDRLGLPACRGAGLVPAGEGQHPHHPASRPDGPQPARPAQSPATSG